MNNSFQFENGLTVTVREDGVSFGGPNMHDRHCGLDLHWTSDCGDGRFGAVTLRDDGLTVQYVRDSEAEAVFYPIPKDPQREKWPLFAEQMKI